MSLVYSEGDSSYWQEFSKAKVLIEQNKSLEAIPILENLNQKNANYNVELSLGDAYSGQGNPSQALNYYEMAYQNAKKENNLVIERVALFKIARTNLWLKKYQEAINSYQELLALQLSDEDKAIANAGLKNAQSNLQAEQEKKKSKEIDLGDAAAAKENPSEALIHYQTAYENAKKENNLPILRVALFKIARTNLWLKKYQDAINSYQQLLALQLSDEDKAIANAGLKTVYQSELNIVLERARDFIKKNEGKNAFALIKNELNKDKDFHLYLVAAQSMAIMENPQQSLEYFKQALLLSNNIADKKIALLGMVKMQLWINDLQAANQTIDRLKGFPLNLSEKKQFEEVKLKIAKLAAQLKFEQLLEQALQFIHSDEGERAYNLIKDYIGSGENYQIDMVAAEAMTSKDSPLKALQFYRKAFSLAVKTSDKVEALFGIAKMQFWLAYYVQAGKSYRLLLQYELSPRDRELALAGLIKSLAYYDRPRLAYRTIPKGFSFKTPQAVIAASQAALWANWADLTKCILTKYYPITSKINPKSGLGRDLRDLRWQTSLATWPNVVTPSIFVSHDSEKFNKKRVTAEYVHYWNQNAQTFLGPDYIQYKQHPSFKLDAKGFYIGQILRPTRSLIFKGRIEPFEYNNLTPTQRDKWQPFLWNFDGTYTPNDYVSAQFLAQKEIIETFPAFNNHITDNLYSGTVNISPLPYVKLNGSITRLNMSDRNSRKGYYFSPSMLVIPDLGITVTGVLRGFTNKFKSPDYFSPHRYMEGKVLLKLGRRLGATWHYYLDGGLGRQYITPVPDSPTTSSPTYQWGIGANGPITKCLFITIYYANIHQASAFINSTGYAYQYGGVSLNILI